MTTYARMMRELLGTEKRPTRRQGSMTPTHDEEMASERAYWHERIVEALQRVRQLDADLTAARDDNKRLVAELRELSSKLLP